MVPEAELTSGFLPRVEPVAELAVVDVDGLPRLLPASFRVDRAFSAKLLKRLEVLLCFTGDFVGPGAFSGRGVGRIKIGLPAAGVGRGKGRTLADAGERTLEALLSTSVRDFFLGASGSIESPLLLLEPEISPLNTLAHMRPSNGRGATNLALLGGRPGPGRDVFVP